MELVGTMLLSLIEGIINALHSSVVLMGNKSLLSIKICITYVGQVSCTYMSDLVAFGSLLVFKIIMITRNRIL